MAENFTPGEIAEQPTQQGSDGPGTGLAPPFRALLDTPAPPADSGVLPTLPGYEVLAEIGRGGMGVVYQARQCALKRLVALKMIRASLNADATVRVRFRTEAEAAARLQHPNIVQIHQVGEHEGRPFLALEFVEGGSLLRRTAGKGLPEGEAAALVETLARAVAAMHQRGILHRDLKPSNVLLTADGTPKITDFGLAKLLDADNGTTRSEAFLGTPSYMAPEQAAGDPTRVGPAADIYALGAILYELLTGRAPFEGATPLSTLEQVRTQEPTPPRCLRAAVSPDLETICLKCLRKEPGQRYASAEALADDLRCFLAGEPIQARPVPLRERLWRSARRHPARVAWALAGTVLVCLLLTGWSYFRATDQLASLQAEDRYQQFLQRRNEALVRALLAPDEGAALLGVGPAGNRRTAESAVREALALAGLAEEAQGPAVHPLLPARRQAEITADCYTLLLVQASLTAQPSPPAEGGKERYREALRLLDRAERLGLQTRSYHLRRAHLLEQLGQRDEARQDRARAESLPPAGPLDHFLLGEEHYRHGAWQQALGSFNRVLGVQPGHFWAQFFLAACHLKVQQWEAARAGLNACLAQQPDFVWAYLLRSFANDKLHAVTEAATDFEKALQLGPNPEARYALFLIRGLHHFNQGEMSRAEADFRSALALKPEQGHAYLNLAHVHLARREFDAAAEQVRTALRFQPPRELLAGYYLERGRICQRDGQYEQAVEACRLSLELVPEQAPAHEVCGRALLELGRPEQAEQAFDQYVRRGGTKTGDLYRGRGLARMKLGKYPQAAADYTAALELAPSADLYQHRGWAHFFAGAEKLALRDFSKALELGPATGDASIGRGLARVMLGAYREAVADAEVALLRKPTTPEMMHNLACLFAQAAARAEADPQEEDREALARGYRGRALQALQQTLALLRPEERSSFWRDKVLPDQALAPIRKEARFQQLHQENTRRQP